MAVLRTELAGPAAYKVCGLSVLAAGERVVFTDRPTEVRASGPADAAIGRVLSVAGDSALVALDGFAGGTFILPPSWKFEVRYPEPDECRWCGCPSPESTCRYCGTRSRVRR